MKKKEQQEFIKQEMFDVVFERIGLGIAIFDLRGEIIYANQSIVEMTGFDLQELLGSSFTTIMVPEMVPAATREFDKLKLGEINTIEHIGKYKRKNETEVWLQLKFTLSKDNLNQPEYIILVADDITEQKRTEKVQEIIYNISDAVISTSDLHGLIGIIQQELGKIMDTTNFYVALYNRSKDTLSLPYFSDDKDQFQEFPAGKSLSAYVIHTGEALYGDKKKIRELEENGEIELVGTDCLIWLGVPLRVKDEIIGMLGIQSYIDENAYSRNDLAVLEFISGQIGISVEKKRAQDELRIERIFFRKIFENLAEAVVIEQDDGTITSINESFTKLFGYSRDETIGVSIDGLILPEEYIEESNALKEKISNNEIFFLQTMRKRKDGSLIPVSILGSPFFVDNTHYTCVIYRDITEQVQAEESLKAAKEKAEESDRLKTAFLANMSHEIRTPMNAIIGFVELLSLPDLTPDDKKEYISVINNSGKILLNLIDDIIDLAKIEADQLKIEYDNCDINLLINEVYTLYEKELKMLGKENLGLRTVMALEGENVVRTDPFRLKQILHNLVGNAIKFTQQGYVEFGYQMQGDTMIHFYVKDTGIGIPKEKQELIFNRFLQVDNSGTRKYGGTGLGLTISKKLTSLLGGEMWVDSEPDVGSVFHFTISYENVKQKSTERAKISTTVDTLAWKEKKLLVVEDNLMNYQLIEEILRKTGIQLILATRADEAIQIVHNRPEIHLVLMDIQMPDASGYDATAAIRKIRPDIPIIAQSAYAMTEEKQKALNCGCNAYLVKPIRPADLISTLNKYL